MTSKLEADIRLLTLEVETTIRAPATPCSIHLSVLVRHAEESSGSRESAFVRCLCVVCVAHDQNQTRRLLWNCLHSTVSYKLVSESLPTNYALSTS